MFKGRVGQDEMRERVETVSKWHVVEWMHVLYTGSVACKS